MNFTKDHIIKYLKGQLPHPEQYELERIILEDPFISDAIEGLQDIDDPEKLDDVLVEIEEMIETNYGKRKVLVPVYRNPLAIAAVISLLVVSIAVILLVPDYREKVQSFLLSDKDKKTETTITDQPETVRSTEEKESITEDSIIQISDEQVASLPTEEEGMSESLISDATPLETQAGITEVIDSSAIDDDFLIAEEVAGQGPAVSDTSEVLITEADIAGEPIQVEETTFEEVTFAENEVDNVETDRAAAKRAAPQAMTQEIAATSLMNVSGRVTSLENNDAIPGVNVIIKGTSKGTITDTNGDYNLQLETNENQLVFSFIGYQGREVSITQSGIYDINLATDIEQLSEVVVVGYGAQTNFNATNRFANPENNRAAYNRYLRDNLVYPDSAAANNISGRVLVEFLVNPDGNISELQVIRGLGYGCDEEALRLIREGPQWRPALENGVPTEERVRVSVRFRP